MYPELTNLLPPERIRGLTREYFIRLITVAVFALAGVVLGSGALLVPSYLYVQQEIQARQTRVNDLDSHLTASQGEATNQRLTTLSSTASYLARLASSTSATAALRGVLAVPQGGIVLTGFTFTPPTQGGEGKMTITGSATTRETLRAYDLALTALPFVSNVDLPIGAYAKESSIPFTITLTGSFAL